MNTRRTLIESDPGQFRPLSLHGSTPVREYKRTTALLRSRLSASGIPDTGFLAEPVFAADNSVEWTTDRFTTEPKPLSALAGEERARYMRHFKSLTSKLRKAASHTDGETRPLLEAVATVPGEDYIFCGDDHIVIANWGMKPTDSSASQMNLLAFTPAAEEQNPSATQDTKMKIRNEEPVTAVPPVKPVTSSSTPSPEKSVPPPPADVPPIVTAGRTPEVPPVIPPTTPPSNNPKKKRKWWKILLIILGVLLLLLLLWLLLSKCNRDSGETVDSIEQVAPPLNTEKIIPSPDSLSYIAGDRLNVYVLKGGELNDFISRFRKEWPDASRYQVVNPDTTLRRVVVICPEEELESMLEEIPRRMEPSLEVVALPENIYEGNARTNDPAMKDTRLSYYFDMTGAIPAWDREMGSEDVIVAVLDGGFDLSHPELQGKIVKPYDAVTHTSQVPNVMACQGHATHVSGTAAGKANNNSGAAGLAPGCKIMPINVFAVNGQSYDSAIIDGIMYAVTQGANVINMSLGSAWGPMMKLLPPEQLEELARTRQVKEAEIWNKVFDFAESRGVTIIKAAGNENIPSGLDPMNRSEHALVVSAVSPAGTQAIFDPLTRDGSNYGPLCRISAPGVEIYNAMTGGNYASLQGTSMAAPQVAGGAALLKSRHPDWDPATIRKVLIGTARPARSPNIGPVMYLAAALDADPNNLPAPESLPDYSSEVPGYGFGPGIPGGGSGLELIINPGEGGGNIPGFPGGEGGGNSPGNPMNPGTPGGGASNDQCEENKRRYDNLLRQKQLIEQQLEQLRRDCPECL